MKFGFAVDPFWSLKNVIDLIVQAETLGYDSAWIPDQTFYADPFPILAVAGRQTRKIALGIGVTNPYTRSAVQVARTIATINELIGRPVILGIGAGNRRDLLLPLGLEQDAPVARCREMVKIIRRLLMGEEITYQSNTMTLDRVKILMDNKFQPEIYVAARGPATLQMAGEVSDGVIIGDLISESGLKYAQTQIGIGMERSKRRSDEIASVCWTTCFITNGDNRLVYENLRPWIAHNLAASPEVVEQALELDKEQIQLLRDTYQRKGPEAASQYINAEDIEKLAIIGPPDKCAEIIKRMQKRGIDQLVLLLYSQNLHDVQLTLNRFIKEVVPLL